MNDEATIGRIVGDKVIVDDSEGRTWNFGLITQDVLADIEKWYDRKRKQSLYDNVKEDNIPRDLYASLYARLDDQPVTLTMVIDVMQSPTGMEFVLWRCLSTHHKNITRKDISTKWNLKDRMKLLEMILSASGMGEDKDENPTEPNPDGESVGDSALLS